MTHDELDVLPEMGGYGQREEDGVIYPVKMPDYVLVNVRFMVDREGQSWQVGTYQGILYKRRQ